MDFTQGFGSFLRVNKDSTIPATLLVASFSRVISEWLCANRP
jgi:hypothetical protein